jgi:TonB family protein
MIFPPRTAAFVLAAALLSVRPAAAQLGNDWPIHTIDPVGSCDLAIRDPRSANHTEVMALIAELYPDSLRGRGLDDGIALVRLRVLADGTVDPASVSVEGATHEAFVEVARTVTPRMRFEPAMVGEAPVAAWMRRRLFFRDPEFRSSGGTIEMLPDIRQPAVQNAREIRREANRHRASPGAALVHVRVQPDGTADSASVRVELATSPEIEEAAAALARRTRFTPATINGRPARVPFWIKVPIHFGCVAQPED